MITSYFMIGVDLTYTIVAVNTRGTVLGLRIRSPNINFDNPFHLHGHYSVLMAVIERKGRVASSNNYCSRTMFT